MDVSYNSYLQLQGNQSPFLYDCSNLLEKSCDPLSYDQTSDPGYFSTTSSLSPTSSVDSFCFSPTSLQAAGSDALDCFIFSSPPAAAPLKRETQTLSSPGSTAAGSSTAKRSRSRYPGKKRQTASEREKLRMRDLTKALHHLRTYLPSSVAPAGQTLTKIETLRLTVQYISYLSAQLGLSEEVLEHRRCSGSVEQPQTLSEILGQQNTGYNFQEPGYDAVETVEPTCGSQHSVPADQLSSLQHPYQVSSGLYCPCVSQQYCSLHQQHPVFSGRC
ncbi:mesoderm posterior aa [Polymixia lowei]